MMSGLELSDTRRISNIWSLVVKRIFAFDERLKGCGDCNSVEQNATAAYFQLHYNDIEWKFILI